MKIIKLTRNKEALVDDQDFDYLNKFNWHSSCRIRGGRKIFYAARKFRKQNGLWSNLYMHKELMKDVPNKVQIDHKDGNTLNNQKENLRLASHGQNLHNRGKQKNNTSGYKGVFYVKITKSPRWLAQIIFNGEQIYLGRFKSPVEAAKAYNIGAIKYHGKFASLNKI